MSEAGFQLCGRLSSEDLIKVNLSLRKYQSLVSKSGFFFGLCPLFFSQTSKLAEPEGPSR